MCKGGADLAMHNNSRDGCVNGVADEPVNDVEEEGKGRHDDDDDGGDDDDDDDDDDGEER